MGNTPNDKTAVTRTAISTLKPGNPKIVLGIEVDPTAGAKTLAEIALGKPGTGRDLFTKYTPQQEYKGGDLKSKGVLYSRQVAASALHDKTVRVRACKANVLNSYDEKSGATVFRSYLTTTEELLAEISVFQGERCLTGGNKTFDKLRDEMKKTTPGINRILIRLTADGGKIEDCIIDGVVHCEKTRPKAKTER
jgi:hypothetical protein